MTANPVHMCRNTYGALGNRRAHALKCLTRETQVCARACRHMRADTQRRAIGLRSMYLHGYLPSARLGSRGTSTHTSIHGGGRQWCLWRHRVFSHTMRRRGRCGAYACFMSKYAPCAQLVQCATSVMSEAVARQTSVYLGWAGAPERIGRYTRHKYARIRRLP